MTAKTRHHLEPEMASLLVRHNPKASEYLAQLMREFTHHRDMDSMTSLGDAIKAAAPGTVLKAVLLETVFSPSGWGLNGTDDEKKFEAEWFSKWQPTPSLALEALTKLAARVKTLDNEVQGIDVDRMIAMIDIAAPLAREQNASVASVFSPFFEQMANLVHRVNAKREQAALCVIEKVLGLDPDTVFRPQSLTPAYDLSKRSKNAHSDSAEGLTFEVSSQNIIRFINSQDIPVESRQAFLGLLERFYPAEILQSQGLDYIRSEPLDMSIGPGMEAVILSRGWLDQLAADELFRAPVTDAVYFKGTNQKFKSVYAVALAAKSPLMNELSLDLLKAFQDAGVNLDRKISCPKGALTYNGSLLHFASMEATAEFVSLLVKNGCDTTARMTSSVTKTGASRGKEGFTPTQLATLFLDQCKDDPSKVHLSARFDGVLAVLRSQNARAIAHQLLDEMALDPHSLATP